VVTVKVGQADGVRPSDCDAADRALALETFPRIEENQLIVPTQRIPVVVSMPGGCL